jgi:hypothetical protein
MINSANFLNARQEASVARFAAQWAAVNLPFATRCALVAVYRRQMSPYDVAKLWMRYSILALNAYLDSASRKTLLSAKSYRWKQVGKPDIDARMVEVRDSQF